MTTFFIFHKYRKLEKINRVCIRRTVDMRNDDVNSVVVFKK